ncbi:MAG: isochorismate synthase [Thermaerobacter sp.]|nr:isochorismate synthase [Thermaerobacter sp.]
MNGHSVVSAHLAQTPSRLRLIERKAAFGRLDPFAAAERAQALSERFFLWQSPDRSRTVFGAGELLRLTADGPERFLEIGAAWRALDLRDAAGALLLGGFAFADAAPGGPCGDLHAADFFVPKVLVESDHASQHASLFDLGEAEGGSDAEQLLYRLQDESSAKGCHLRLLDPPGAKRSWSARIRAAAAEIERGGFEKVVLARVRIALYDRPPALSQILRTLSEREPDCRIFAFGDGRRVFLGATPELLCLCREGTARVDCLAGSAPRSADPAADEAIGQTLLRSAKNRREHAHVVRAVESALAGLGLAASAPDGPRLRRLAHVQHLYTPITALLSGNQDLFRLARALHPTPAVGGAPRDAALAWIAPHEGLRRGFYAGAVGFVDAREDGEFDVAIRSALLLRRSARLYAGCGIVQGSDPDEEFRESEIKMRPLETALRRDR